MKYAIDETELARLEALAEKASKMPFFPDGFDVQDNFDQILCRCIGVNDLSEDVQEGNVHYIAAACNAVPALVAEVRRLRAEVKQGSADYCALMDKHDAQFVRAEKLREEVNWLAKMCATHCRDKSFDNAQCSIQDCAPLHCYHARAEQWKEAAREAIC